MRGVLRSLAVAAAGGGLVLGAAHLPSLNLVQATGQAGDARVTRTHAEAVTKAQRICPGPEALGIEGLPDAVAQTVTVAAVTAPPAALPEGFATAQGTGSLAVSGLPLGGMWGAPATARGQVVSGQISTAQSVLVTGTGAIAPEPLPPNAPGSRWATTVAWSPRPVCRRLTPRGSSPEARSRAVANAWS